MKYNAHIFERPFLALLVIKYSNKFIITRLDLFLITYDASYEVLHFIYQ